MSTWHQDKALARGTPLWHATLWTVVQDKPNQPMGVIRFATQAEADLNAKNSGGYVIPPSGSYPRE